MHVHNICIYIRPTFKRLQKGFLALHYLLAFAQLMSTESMISFNYLILCHPPSPPALNLSQHHSFFHCVSSSQKWPRHWGFSFSISPSNEYSGLIYFRIDWFDLLTVQGTLKSLLQHHSSKASILQCSAFLMVQLSHPHMTTGKTTALTR